MTIGISPSVDCEMRSRVNRCLGMSHTTVEQPATFSTSATHDNNLHLLRAGASRRFVRNSRFRIPAHVVQHAFAPPGHRPAKPLKSQTRIPASRSSHQYWIVCLGKSLPGSGIPKLLHQRVASSRQLLELLTAAFEFLALRVDGLNLCCECSSRRLWCTAGSRRRCDIVPVVSAEDRCRQPLAVDQIGAFGIRSPGVPDSNRP